MSMIRFSPFIIIIIIFFFFFFFLSVAISSAVASEGSSSSPEKAYIIHVQLPPGLAEFSSPEDRVSWYLSFLPSRSPSLAESRLVHCYSRIFNGFAARLTDQDLLEIKNKTGFMYAHPDRILPLQTTHTPSFLGLQRDAAGFWNDSNYGKGVIIGVLDTGISPNHSSFGDAGIPPPPAKWKGVCDFNVSDCNNKLIGARDLTVASNSTVRTLAPTNGPYDYEGHGTHTASTAAGNFVDDANINGLANGTAAGVAPLAHLAIYKVCATSDCLVSDILKGMDAAIADGVDVMSLSLAGPSIPFYEDDTAIAALAAVNNGIFLSCAAGNGGPEQQTLSNEAPWLLTVGASTMDRSIETTVTLGKTKEMDGQSAYQPIGYKPTRLPLVYPGFGGVLSAALCGNGSLDGIDVRGKIVVCLSGNISSIIKGAIVNEAGGLGIIVANLEVEGSTIFEILDETPASHVNYTAGQSIIEYASYNKTPTASITFEGTLLGTNPAPALAFFSSRGPSQADPNILKPDIIGPGVNVLAAWPFLVGYAGTKFNMISGTSMATPHLSGVAALLKSTHPDWSPAAIKSAIMTTANITANDGNSITDETGNPADPFGIGAGHVVPARANNPGLIYDIPPENYLEYLCGLGYSDQQVSAVAGSTIICADIGSISPENLNYPSLTVFLTVDNGYTTQVNRTVTNVGAPNSTYTLQITSTFGDVIVDVEPEQLSFTDVNQAMPYSVKFSYMDSARNIQYQGFLTWVLSDGITSVRSPIVIFIV